MGTTEIDIGRRVECDMCGENLTDDTRRGGFLFGSKGVGPCCVERVGANIRKYGEEWNIRARCPEDTAFADWIRDLRAQTPGGSTVRVYQGDEALAVLRRMRHAAHGPAEDGTEAGA